MKFTEEELRQAAIRVQNRHLAQLTPKEQCADTFRASYAQQMQELILQAKAGRIQAAPLRMGWQYYTSRGTAAVVLCFLLACVAMPEVVQAGCQKIIEAVETVFEEYTEYRYTSTASTDITFVPLTLGYLPEGLEKINKNENPTGIRLAYADKTGKKQFVIHQELLTKDRTSTYIVDTESAKIEKMFIQEKELTLITKDNQIQFLWIFDAYRITGKSNLSKVDVIKILECIKVN